MKAKLELRTRLGKAAQGKQPVDLLDLADLLRAEQHYREALEEIASTETATPTRPELILERVVWGAKHALGLSFGQPDAEADKFSTLKTT
jgi:hypothetical protein